MHPVALTELLHQKFHVGDDLEAELKGLFRLMHLLAGVDLVVQVADAKNLVRALVVSVQLAEAGVPFVLAGSLRDDGPLPDTMMDLIAAQDRYSEALSNVDLVLVLSSMLHGIGVGNMLPARVRVVCVDINPAVVTKLADRGSSQTIGLVTDVGLFLHHLAQKLRE